jgi:hypothetical protein
VSSIPVGRGWGGVMKKIPTRQLEDLTEVIITSGERIAETTMV